MCDSGLLRSKQFRLARCGGVAAEKQKRSESPTKRCAVALAVGNAAIHWNGSVLAMQWAKDLKTGVKIM